MKIKIPQINVTFHDKRLADGSNLFLFERKNMPIAIRASFFAGSRFGKIPGTAHFLEHMLVTGSKRYPTKAILAEHIESIGGNFSASTGTDILRVNTVIPDPSDFSFGIEFISELLQKPTFDHKTIETERSVIYSELGKSISNPSVRVWNTYLTLFMQDTLVGRPVLGEENDISNITKNSLETFYDQNIVSGKLTYIISGDIGIEEAVQTIEEKILIQQTKRYVINDPLKIHYERTTSVEKEVANNYVQIITGFRTSSVKEKKQRLVLDVLEFILSYGRASKLLERLRYDKPLVYNAQAINLKGSDHGSFVVSTSCKKNNTDQVLEEIKKIFREISTKGITDDELRLVWIKFKKTQRILMQSSTSWINLFEKECMFSPENFDLSLFSDKPPISAREIIEVAKEFFQEDLMYTALCGDV